METRSQGENIVLNALKERYQNGEYCTWAADILLILRSSEGIKNFLVNDQNKESKNSRDSFVKATYEAMVSETDEESCDQTVVLRGLSGTGKTKTCKKLINSLFMHHSRDNILKSKINHVFMLLEAFGHARTSSNVDSSRLASTFTLYFQDLSVVGMNMTQFLCDPGRVVDQSEGSSNFHVFYYAIAGKDDEMKTMYRLLKNQSALSKQDFDQYKERRRLFIDAFKVIGFSTQEQSDTMLILMTILTLGNVTFKRSKYGDLMMDEESKNILKSSAEIMGLDEEELCECLTSKSTFVSKEEIVKGYTRDEAEDFMDFLLWTIYGRLFAWLITSINERLRPECEHSEDSINSRKLRHIHVVNFPGKEIFHLNSFEQFMINILDDVLHYSFVENYFSLDEEEYRKDGLDWSPWDLNIDTGLANMLLLPGALLDTISNNFREDKTPPTSAECLFSGHSDQGKQFFKANLKRPSTFTMIHYDNEAVSYDIRGWSQKNRQKLPGRLITLLKNSENPLLSLLFKAKFGHNEYMRQSSIPAVKKSLSKDKCLSPSMHFKTTIIEFLRRFKDTNTSYICCIKPSSSSSSSSSSTSSSSSSTSSTTSSSSSSSSSNYDFDYVQKQFENMRVKDVVYNFKNINQVVFTVEEFFEKYSSLLTPPSSSSSPSSSIREMCIGVLNSHLPVDSWKLGKSKIFIKQSHLAHLNKVMRSKKSKLKENPRPNNREDIEALYSKPIRPNKQQQLSRDKVQTKTNNKIKQEGEGHQMMSISRKNSKYARIQVVLDWSHSVPNEQQTPHQQLLERNDSSSESDIENWIPLVKGKNFGEVGTRKASVKWFKATQAKQLVQENGFYADWFHGIISRRKTEVLLKDKTNGCFLIRVGESRLGYSLSFKDKKKCRHYMIDELSGGKFKIIGERTTHSSMLSLVDFYKKNKISNWDGYLTTSCNQTDGECDYADLMLTPTDIQENQRK